MTAYMIEDAIAAEQLQKAERSSRINREATVDGKIPERSDVRTLLCPAPCLHRALSVRRVLLCPLVPAHLASSMQSFQGGSATNPNMDAMNLKP